MCSIGITEEDFLMQCQWSQIACDAVWSITHASKVNIPYDNPACLPFKTIFIYLSGPNSKDDYLPVFTRIRHQWYWSPSSDWHFIRLATPLQPRRKLQLIEEAEGIGTRQEESCRHRSFHENFQFFFQLRCQCLELKYLHTTNPPKDWSLDSHR